MRNRILSTVCILLAGTLFACGDTDNPNPEPDPEPVDEEQQCDLRLSKSIDGEVAPSSMPTYEIVVDNVGDAACAPPVVVEDRLPPGVQFSSVVASNWNCTTTSTQPEELECEYGNGAIPPSGSPVLRFEANVGDRACMASNCAEVGNGESAADPDQSPRLDGALGNNRDCASAECGDVEDCVDPPSGMVGWWTADQTGDDESNENNHGSLVNGTHYSTGQVLESFAFDGADHHVEVPDDDSLDFGETDQFSIDAWVYPEEGEDAVRTILDKRAELTDGPRGYALQIRSDTLVVRTQNGGASPTYTSSGSVPADEWTHVTVTVDLDADQGTVYLDGTQDGTFQPSSTGAGTLESDAPLYIGRHYDGEHYFDGRIDEVEIFDRVLDASEVSALVDAGPCGKCRVGCVDGEETRMAGQDDEFQDDTDDASPSPYLQDAYGPLKPFDDDTLDDQFGHTFTNLKPTLEHQHICGAELEIRMRPSDGSGLVDNDTIVLNFSDGNGNQVGARWGARIGSRISGDWTPSNTGARTFTFDLANLPPGGGDPTNIMADLDSHEMLNVRVQDDTEVDYATLTLDYSCEACDWESGEPDLAVEKSHEGSFQVGQSDTYTISVENVGTDDASPPTDVTDEVPQCLEIEGIASPWDAWCNVSGQQVSCSYPDPIAAGSTTPGIELEVRPSGDCGDTVENCAEVSHDADSNASNDESCITDEVEQERNADLRIEKSHSGKLSGGAANTYDITVFNDGPGAAQTPVTVKDDLPQCLSYGAASPSAWSCSSSSGVVTCDHPGPLPSGQNLSLQLEVEHSNGCGDMVENCAKVEGNGDPDTSNNEACDQSLVSF